jgi:hypothetical protein
MPVQSAILFETVQEIYERVFLDLRPNLSCPRVRVEFHPFTSLSSRIRLVQGQLTVKISDLLEGAPAPIQEALAYILVSKLFRQTPPRPMAEVYRRYLMRQEVWGHVERTRRERSSKRLRAPSGHHFHLEEIFRDLNHQYFAGSLEMPLLGWSLRKSRTILGHYDSSHDAIAISPVLDQPHVPYNVVAYVVYHEMLHIKHPVDRSGAKRRVHTKAFQAEEKCFAHYAEAKAFLKKGLR